MSEPAVEILRPTRGWAGFRLGEVWRYRELLLFFAWRNILIRYKQTVVGIGWAVLQPLLLMVVMTLFFSSYAKQAGVPGRSEERRVGKECGARWLAWRW